jgi:hypothetical protein
VHVDGDSSPVVDDADAAISLKSYVDLAGVTSHCFIYRVVYDLVDKVVKASLACGADIHAWAFTNGIKAL